ncbi:glutathione S-transferase family protein [Agrobacterium sp. ES01]|uniref:glutathione S-transferase family protein n=1 Tax=Agrobacterium sp. ES01 TaxID=3420714 RepID=UPI003D1381D6
MIPIVLRSTTTSPFGRKVRVAAQALGLGDRIIRRDADTRNAADDLRCQNPLGKMPCLLIAEEAFYDSGVILELFDLLAGGARLLPCVSQPLERARALTRARLADGIADAALLMVYEDRFREATQRSAVWLDHQRGKIERALAAFEQSPPRTDRADIVNIGLACALGYLDWRRPVEWRDAHPRLVSWFDQFSTAIPAFQQTESESA